MQYGPQKFITLFPNKHTKLQANEVYATFGFNLDNCRHFMQKRTIKTRNLKEEVKCV